MSLTKQIYENTQGPWAGGWGYKILENGFCKINQPHSPNDINRKIESGDIALAMADLIIMKLEGIVPETGSPALAVVYPSEEAAINENPLGVDIHALALLAWHKENPE